MHTRRSPETEWTAAPPIPERTRGSSARISPSSSRNLLSFPTGRLSVLALLLVHLLTSSPDDSTQAQRTPLSSHSESIALIAPVLQVLGVDENREARILVDGDLTFWAVDGGLMIFENAAAAGTGPMIDLPIGHAIMALGRIGDRLVLGLGSAGLSLVDIGNPAAAYEVERLALEHRVDVLATDAAGRQLVAASRGDAERAIAPQLSLVGLDPNDRMALETDAGAQDAFVLEPDFLLHGLSIREDLVAAAGTHRSHGEARLFDIHGSTPRALMGIPVGDERGTDYWIRAELTPSGVLVADPMVVQHHGLKSLPDIGPSAAWSPSLGPSRMAAIEGDRVLVVESRVDVAPPSHRLSSLELQDDAFQLEATVDLDHLPTWIGQGWRCGIEGGPLSCWDHRDLPRGRALPEREWPRQVDVPGAPNCHDRVVLHQDSVLVACGDRIAVLNASGPARTRVQRYLRLDGPVEQGISIGGRLFVLLGPGRGGGRSLQYLSVEADGILAERVELDEVPREIHAAGATLALLESRALKTLDPASLTVLGSLPTDLFIQEGMQVRGAGAMLHVVVGDLLREAAVWQSFDLGDPSQPRYSGEPFTLYREGFAIEAVEFFGDTAVTLFIPSQGAGRFTSSIIGIHDLSVRPPRLLAERPFQDDAPLHERPNGMSFRTDTRMYVSRPSGYLSRLDTSDPREPAAMSAIGLLGDTSFDYFRSILRWHVDVQGQRLALPLMSGLQVMDLVEPGPARTHLHWSPSARAYDARWREDRFVSFGQDHSRLHRPDGPDRLLALDGIERVVATAVNGDRMIALGGSSSREVIDLRLPNADAQGPSLLGLSCFLPDDGRCPNRNPPRDGDSCSLWLRLDGDQLIGLSRNRDLSVYDVSMPGRMLLRGSTSLPACHRLRDLLRIGDHILVGGSHRRDDPSPVWRVDVADPARPRVLGAEPLLQGASEIQIEGNRLFALLPSELVLFDIDEAGQLAPLARAATHADAHRLRLSGSRLFYQVERSIHVLEHSAPDAWTRLGALDLPDLYSFDVWDGRILVTPDFASEGLERLLGSPRLPQLAARSYLPLLLGSR